MQGVAQIRSGIRQRGGERFIILFQPFAIGVEILLRSLTGFDISGQRPRVPARTVSWVAGQDKEQGADPNDVRRDVRELQISTPKNGMRVH